LVSRATIVINKEGGFNSIEPPPSRSFQKINTCETDPGNIFTPLVLQTAGPTQKPVVWKQTAGFLYG
jgi:hypothetical protein